jgi:hypothetical protein
MKRLGLSALVLVALLGGCTKKGADTQTTSTPEQTVKTFVELSAGAKDKADKAKIQALCVGELRRAFDRMTDELFQMSYLSSNVTIQDLKILESKVEGESAKVQYQISIENKAGTDTTQEVNQREVELTRNQGAWQIESIRIIGSDNVAFTRGMIF